MVNYSTLRTNPKQNTCKAFLRDYEILIYYKELQEELAWYIPMLPDYIQEGYYYDLISQAYGITSSHVCSKMRYLKSLTQEELEEFNNIAKRCYINKDK